MRFIETIDVNYWNEGQGFSHSECASNETVDVDLDKVTAKTYADFVKDWTDDGDYDGYKFTVRFFDENANPGDEPVKEIEFWDDDALED